MANQTITKTPEGFKEQYFATGEWPSSWSSVPSGLAFEKIAYRVATLSNVQINRLSFLASFTPNDSRVTAYSVYCSIYAEDPTVYQLTPLATASFSKNDGAAASHTFPFEGLSIESNYVYFVLEGIAEMGESILADGVRIGTPSVSVTFEAPALQVTVNPTSIYVNNSVTVGFNNTRLGQTIKLRPYYGSSTPLGSEISVTSDTYELKGVESWFNTASVTGDTMRVTLHASDALGRTNSSASFELKRRKALTPTITNPTGTKDAGSAITFSWTSSGDGTQKKAVLQWSTDRITWTELKTLTSSAQSWSAPAATFPYPGGLIYWRIKLTNSYGIESDWVQGSFTAQYTPATVTLETPVSGSYNGAEEIDFSWSITSGSGSITGVQVDYSTDGGGTWTRYITRTYGDVGFTAPAMLFPAGTVRWRVRAKDSYSGYVNNWQQASFTVTYGSLQVTASPPSIYADETVTIGFNGTRLGQTVKIQPYYGSSTPLGSEISVTSDTYELDGNESWFNTAAVTGDTMRVTLHASDTLGRTNNSGSFELKRRQALTPTITNPTGTKDAGSTITFSWTSSGDGTQTKATLEWSTDRITWQALTTRSGTAQSWTAPAGKFPYPGGLIYWRIKLTNSYGKESAWVQGSFTAQYTPASATLITPTSGSRDGAESIPFSWTSTKGSGSINGTQMQVSTDDGVNWKTVLDASRQTLSYTSNPAAFPSGTLKWRVRFSDSYAGYVDNWQEARFTVAYDAVSQAVPVNTPTSGIISANTARVFQIGLQASGPVYAPFTVSAATFYWRSGESGDFTAVTMTPNGNTASATIAAGTFPSGILQWYAEATDNTNRTTSTDTYTLQALNANVEAAPVSPVNTLESGSGPITFIWSYGSIDGTPQSKAQIRYSSDGGTHWTTLPDISGSGTRTTVAAGTFPGGTITWQVRAYNSAGTAGPWSASVSFLSFSAPLVSGVTGDGKPFLTVSWQVEGQQAYEVEVNGRTYGPYYGEDVRSYTLPEPLPDGTYVARVRAQNRYGLWSEWAEGNVDVANNQATTFSLAVVIPPANTFINLSWDNMFVLNPPILISQSPRSYQATSGSVVFTVSFRTSAFASVKWQRQVKTQNSSVWQSFGAVTTTAAGATKATFQITASQSLDGNQYRFHLWNDACDVYSDPATFRYLSPSMYTSLPNNRDIYPETGYFIIYRDGVPIGKTYARIFADRTAVGQPTYTVIQVFKNGYYQSSDEKTAPRALQLRCPVIAPLDGGDFIELKLSENSQRTQRFTRSRQVIYTVYAGMTFPAAEVGEHETLTGSFDVAYLQTDADSADAFAALLGEAVILKTPGNQVAVGILEGWELGDMRFYRSYSCTLQQMDWGEFIDETSGL